MDDDNEVQTAISRLRRFCPPVVVNDVLTVIEAYERLVRQIALGDPNKSNSIESVVNNIGVNKLSVNLESVNNATVNTQSVNTDNANSTDKRKAYMRAYMAKKRSSSEKAPT